MESTNCSLIVKWGEIRWLLRSNSRLKVSLKTLNCISSLSGNFELIVSLNDFGIDDEDEDDLNWLNLDDNLVVSRLTNFLFDCNNNGSDPVNILEDSTIWKSASKIK